MNTIITRYRDVPWRDYRCSHMRHSKAEAETIALWNQMRSTTVTIDLDDFVKGHCHNCDAFGVMPDRKFIAVRSSLELGD